MKTNTTEKQPMWATPIGWHKAATEARDSEALYHELVANNENRKARGLPTFEPSYELAIAIIRKT